MFSEKETQIYRYWNGCTKDGKQVFQFVDPVEVQINLEEHDPNYQSNFKTLFDLVQISKDADAAKEIVDLGRIMFKLPEPFDDGERVQGHTTLGVMRVVLDYINWMSDLKKNIDDTPTLLPLTGSEEEKLDMNVSVDSGSTSQEK